MSDSAELVRRPQPFRAVSYPWRLYCGAGALDNLPAEVARHGARRAFVICGQTVAHRTNLLARIRDRLGDVYGGVFDRMDKDSSYSAVRAATDAARAAAADLLIAVGGGSVIVGARVIAILLAEKGDAYELMTQYPEGKPPVSPRLMAPKLPIVNVLTTPTTAMNRAGSGLGTMSSIIAWSSSIRRRAPSRSSGTRKPCSPPRCRWRVRRARRPSRAALHGVAGGSTNPLVEGDHLQAFRLASRALPRLVAEPDDAAPRIDLCTAAFLQNRAADDGAARDARDRASSAAYALATALHIRYDHVGQGEATSAVTPTVVRGWAASRGAGGRRMAEALGVATERMAPEAASAAAADALDAFYRGIGMPARVRELGIPEAELPLLARDTLKNFNANRGAPPTTRTRCSTCCGRAGDQPALLVNAPYRGRAGACLRGGRGDGSSEPFPPRETTTQRPREWERLSG